MRPASGPAKNTLFLSNLFLKEKSCSPDGNLVAVLENVPRDGLAIHPRVAAEGEVLDFDPPLEQMNRGVASADLWIAEQINLAIGC